MILVLVDSNKGAYMTKKKTMQEEPFDPIELVRQMVEAEEISNEAGEKLIGNIQRYKAELSARFDTVLQHKDCQLAEERNAHRLDNDTAEARRNATAWAEFDAERRSKRGNAERNRFS
jgi:hypothetical protein